MQADYIHVALSSANVRHVVTIEGGELTVRIGPITIHRYRRNKAGLEIYPWQALTTDRLTPEVRQLVAKMARSECRTFLESLKDETQ